MGKIRIPKALDPMRLGEFAREAVLEFAALDQPGKQKHRAAVRRVAKVVDKAIEVPGPIGLLVEIFDGPLARLLLGAVVKHAYNALVAEGAIEGESDASDS